MGSRNVNIVRYALASAAALCALAVPTTAQAATITNNTGGPVTLNDKDVMHPTGTASPYPDEIDITGGDGPITKVVVTVNMISHTSAGDVDLALVSPSGAKSILMSDVCGTNNTITNLTFTFDELAVGTLPTSGCTSGTFQTTDIDPGDNWPAPGPGTGLTPNLANFNGSSPNGDWKLFSVDDSAFQGGSIASWGLTITTSPALIVVPGLGPTSGTASPYSSVKTFPTGNGQVIDDVNLTVTGFNHEHPADVDMLLQGPTGETVMVMSDACGGDDIANGVDYIFDDEAALQLSDGNSTNCSSGSRRPSDFGDPPEDMPLPLPPRPYGASMSVFDGLPGGTFRLWVNDDAGSDIGYIGGWNLTMTTRPPAATGFAATAVPTAEGQTAQLTVNRTGSANLGAATVNVAVVDGQTDSRDFGHALPTKLDFAPGEASKTIEIPINADLEAEDAETFQVALADATGDAALANATSIAEVTIARSVPDTTSPELKMGGKKTQKLGGFVTVKVSCPAEACEIGAAGSLVVGAGKGNRIGLKRFKLKPTSAQIPAGTTKTLKLRIPRKARKAAAKALKRGGKVSAKVTVTATDGARNTRTGRRTVRLVP